MLTCRRMQLYKFGTVYSPEEVDLSFFSVAKLRTRRGGKLRPSVQFADIICAFDIETTDDGEESFMWGWQFAFLAGPGSEEARGKRGTHYSLREPVVVFGDTWEQFIYLLRRIRDAMPEDVKAVIYIHNASYEYCYLKGILPIQSGFVVGNKIARLDLPGFEIRCSYCYSNKSLLQWTRGRVKHEKAAGDLDFTKYREPGCAMTEQEAGYRYNDVAGLCEVIYKEYQIYKENIATAVMTSTGHVRREINRAADYKLNEIKWNCEQRLYMVKKLHRAFRGGDCHGNRSMLGLIHEGVTSRDKKSSYPSVLMTKKYPVSAFVPIQDCSREGWNRWSYAANYRCFALLKLSGVAIKTNAPDPYIARAKVESCAGGECENGRILYADSITLYALDIDWRIIMDAYEIQEVEVLEAYAAKADYLPTAFLQLIREFFRQKEVLGAAVKRLKREGKLEAAEAMEEERGKFKGLVNSLYGCLAEWMHTDELVYNPEKLDFDPVEPHDDEGNKISFEEYEELVWKRRNKSRLPYQWGVWCTAWARYEYYKGVKAVCGNYSHPGEWIYGDTDSCKYLSTPEIESRFDALNAAIRAECEAAPVPAWVEVDGKRIYLGEWETEDTYALFRTWGAKKYAYRLDDGSVHVTVSGLGKKSGSEYLHMLGGIHAFDLQLTVPEQYSGRTRAIYSDPTPAHKKTLRSGREILTAGYIRILPTTYTLDIKDELAFLLQALGTLDGLDQRMCV